MEKDVHYMISSITGDEKELLTKVLLGQCRVDDPLWTALSPWLKHYLPVCLFPEVFVLTAVCQAHLKREHNSVLFMVGFWSLKMMRLAAHGAFGAVPIPYAQFPALAYTDPQGLFKEHAKLPALPLSGEAADYVLIKRCFPVIRSIARMTYTMAGDPGEFSFICCNSNCLRYYC